VDWSLTDEAGKVVVIRDQPLAVLEAALDALDQASFAEIRQAIEAHETAMAQEREAEQARPTGEIGSSPIS
jgi:hypothetical protein